MKPTKPKIRRLLKLAKHLESGKLGHDQFNYSIYHDEDICGTAGCAIGECPFVFPEHWVFRRTGRYGVKFLKLKSAKPGQLTRDSSMEFFGLSLAQHQFLFVPGMRGSPLSVIASRQEVAAHIRKFVEKIRAGV